MANISVSLPSDGETADVSDYNTPINTIVNEINGNLDNSNIDAAAAISGTKLADASITNAKLSTTAGELGGAWVSWVPTFTNLTGGTLNYAKYTRVGKTITFRIKYTLAGAGVSGGITFTTPVAMNADYTAAADAIDGIVGFADTGSSFSPGVMRWASSTTIQVYAQGAGSTYVGTTSTSSTVPFTWGNTDTISIAGTFEAA